MSSVQGGLTRRRFLGLGAAVGGALVLGGTAAAAASTSAENGKGKWPTTLQLPNGFHPAGIGIGSQPYAYFGSLLGGAIYRASLVTGQGSVINPGLGPDYNAVGLQVDRHQRLFVAGGFQRLITVMDGGTGEVLRTYQVGVENTIVNHVVVTRQAAWFTDAFNGLLFGLPFGPRGELPDEVVTLPLTGEWVQDPEGWVTATGIAAGPDGALLVVNIYENGGTLYRVDPATGVARKVDLGGLELRQTNGIAVQGRTLYLPRHQDVSVVELDRAVRRGTLRRQVTDPRFEVPCAAAIFGDRLYLTNSRFGVDPTPETTYNAVSIPLPA